MSNSLVSEGGREEGVAITWRNTVHVHARVLHILEETLGAEVHITAQEDLMNTTFGLV